MSKGQKCLSSPFDRAYFAISRIGDDRTNSRIIDRILAPLSNYSIVIVALEVLTAVESQNTRPLVFTVGFDDRPAVFRQILTYRWCLFQQ